MSDVSKREAADFLERWPELRLPLASARCGATGIVQMHQPLEGMKLIVESGIEAAQLVDPSGRDDWAVLMAADAIATAAVDYCVWYGANRLGTAYGGEE